MFPVCTERRKSTALNEAWDLERALVEEAEYKLWLYEGRDSPEEAPRSVSLKDINKFNEWLKQQKEENDIQGVYIMIVYHFLTSILDICVCMRAHGCNVTI